MSSVLSWQELKRRASFLFYGLKARKYRLREKPTSQGTTLVAGLLSSPNGIGQGARLIREGLEASGYDVSVFDLTPTIQPNLSRLPVISALDGDDKGPVILHVNPTEVPKALHVLRDKNLLNRRLIGVWAWELEYVPEHWKNCAQWFDEIWSISQFSQKSFETLPVPVFNVGYPIQLLQTPLSKDWKSELNVENKICIFTSFDSRSSLSRKNPKATVAAFLKATSGRSDVVLIVKVSGDLDAGDRAIFDVPNIILIDTYLDREDMAGLIRSCDCYLSLTRAEGFGLVAAEAAANGIPTLITGWSAPAEWRNSPSVHLIDYALVPTKDTHRIYDDIEGRRWAEPNIEHAAELLGDMLSLSPSERKNVSDKAKQWWKEAYGVAAFESRLSSDTRAAMRRIKDFPKV